ISSKAILPLFSGFFVDSFSGVDLGAAVGTDTCSGNRGKTAAGGDTCSSDSGTDSIGAAVGDPGAMIPGSEWVTHAATIKTTTAAPTAFAKFLIAMFYPPSRSL
ncbi:MAG: hypothetical protein V3S68_06480, partial [Dehalococcoidia bacterium]